MKITKIIVAALLLTPFLASAGGFQLNVQGMKAIGMGGAGVAFGSEASSVFFNPGAMTQLDGHNFSFGINFIDPAISLQTPETANIDHTSGVGTPFFFYYSGSLLKEKLDDKLKVGFLVNNQFGSGSSLPNDWQGRYIIQNISLKTFMFQPTLSYKIHDKLSIGAGFVYTTGSFNTERGVPVGTALTEEGQVRLEGSGSGTGFNAGIYSQFLTIGDEDGERTEFALGLDYRSQLAVELSGGDATFTNIPVGLSDRFPASTKFDSKITLPSVFTAGISVKHVKEDWSLEFAYDLNLTGWSSYDSLNFDFENEETDDSKTFQNWENTLTHRFGLDFVYKDTYSVRLGAYYDNTPMPDGFVSPHLPGITQLAYTFGLGYKVNDMFSVDLAYIRQDAERETGLDSAGFSAKYHRIVNVYSIGLNLKLGGSKKPSTTTEG